MQNFGIGGRSAWVFNYTAGQLAYGAQKQKEYREERVQIWTAAQEKVMTEIRSSGIEVTEDVMSQLQISATYSKSGGRSRGPTVSINEELSEKFSQCVAKVEEHKTLAEQYEGWIQTLSAQPAKELEVTQSDFLYFFLNVKDIPAPGAEVGPTQLPPDVALKLVARMPKAEVTSLDPPTVMLKPAGSGIPAMTAPPLQAKGPVMPTVPSLGPATAGVFVPPDIDVDTLGLSDDWPND